MPEFTLYIQPGATRRLSVEWLSGGEPVDLTGCVSSLRVYDRSGTQVFLFDATDDAITQDDPTGTFSLWIPDETTAEMVSAARYVWAVDHPNGDVTYLLEGPVEFGQPGKNQDGVVRIDQEKITVINQGIQGVPGPPGTDATGIIDGGTFN